jgi:hypothetical protein
MQATPPPHPSSSTDAHADTPTRRQFEAYYLPLADLVRTYKLQGLDLDVEERTNIDVMRRLIRRLNADFGPSFIITLAPVYAAMLPRHPRFLGISRRILNATTLPAPGPIMAALCKAKGVHSIKNLSGFNHFDLATSDVGEWISWYNVQLYCGWGWPDRPGAYEAMVEAGWKPEQLVMGVVTNPGNGDGHVESDALAEVVRGLREKYGDRFGGIMGWEYFNAGMHRPVEGPWEWVRKLGEALGRV